MSSKMSRFCGIAVTSFVLTIGGALSTTASAAPDDFDDGECTDLGGATWCYSEELKQNTNSGRSDNGNTVIKRETEWEYSSNTDGTRFYYEERDDKIHFQTKDDGRTRESYKTKGTYGSDQAGFEYECTLDSKVTYVDGELRQLKDKSTC